MKGGATTEKIREGKRQAKREVKKLFNHTPCAKRKRKDLGSVQWKHKFVCLAYRDQHRIPTTDVEKDDLLQAGLGEKPGDLFQ